MVTNYTFASHTANDPSDSSVDLTESSQQSSSPSFTSHLVDPITSSQQSLLPSVTSHPIQQHVEVRPEEWTSSPNVAECE